MSSIRASGAPSGVGLRDVRTDYAVAETGRYNLNRADWFELRNHCHIYYDGVDRPLAAPRSERELEAHHAHRMEPFKRFMDSRGADPRELEEAQRRDLDRWMRSSTVRAVRRTGSPSAAEEPPSP